MYVVFHTEGARISHTKIKSPLPPAVFHTDGGIPPGFPTQRLTPTHAVFHKASGPLPICSYLENYDSV